MKKICAICGSEISPDEAEAHNDLCIYCWYSEVEER